MPTISAPYRIDKDGNRVERPRVGEKIEGVGAAPAAGNFVPKRLDPRDFASLREPSKQIVGTEPEYVGLSALRELARTLPKIVPACIVGSEAEAAEAEGFAMP